ncbi:translation initiation factor IF-2-like [Oenanthe melanoleuca]|uniref:translation initiation factor IF-2-like n=1 Tax=Oenanthe melanoleuca TaxID=2939378 RepID=UPI0024C1C472|nr:translation initiation factor IF-2-like [Oenanthe melanoleuca]
MASKQIIEEFIDDLIDHLGGVQQGFLLLRVADGFYGNLHSQEMRWTHTQEHPQLNQSVQREVWKTRSLTCQHSALQLKGLAESPSPSDTTFYPRISCIFLQNTSPQMRDGGTGWADRQDAPRARTRRAHPRLLKAPHTHPEGRGRAPARGAEPPARGQPGPAPSQRPARAPPELQLVQVLEQAAGAVGHGGGAVEAAAELPARLLLLLRLLLRPLAGLGADPGLGHPTRRCRRRNLAAAAPSPRPAGGGGGRMPAPRSWPKKEPPRRRPPRPPRPRAGPAGAASRSAAGPPRLGPGRRDHRAGQAGRDPPGRLVQPPRPLSSDGDSTTSLGNQFQGSSTSKVKKFFVLRWNCLCISLYPLSLVLLLGTTEKRLVHLLDTHPLDILETQQFPDVAEGRIHGSGQPTKTRLQSPQHPNNNNKDGPT